MAVDPIEERALLVVGLCAAWCGTCAEFSRTFDEVAALDRRASYVWLDIEDDDAIAGDIDIETFPTVAVFAGDRLLHYGTTLPQRDVLVRLVRSLDAGSPTVRAEAAVEALPDALRRVGAPRPRRPGAGHPAV